MPRAEEMAQLDDHEQRLRALEFYRGPHLDTLGVADVAVYQVEDPVTIVIADTTLGSVTIRLPDTFTLSQNDLDWLFDGRHVLIKRATGGGNSVTVVPSPLGSDTIDGASSKSLPNQYDWLHVLAVSANIWYIVAKGP